VGHPGCAGPLLPKAPALASAAVVQSVCLNICDCPSPPRCAPEQGKRPHTVLPGLQRQSFDTPPPQRVIGVSNQEDVKRAVKNGSAAGRRMSWSGAQSPRLQKERTGDSVPQCRRCRKGREENDSASGGEEVKGGHQSCRRWWSVPKGNAPPPRYGVPHPPLRNLGAEKETSPLFVPRLWLVQCVGMSDNHEERFLGPRPSESHGCQR
jgi:hypothetical protein